MVVGGGGVVDADGCGYTLYVAFAKDSSRHFWYLLLPNPSYLLLRTHSYL